MLNSTNDLVHWYENNTCNQSQWFSFDRKRAFSCLNGFWSYFVSGGCTNYAFYHHSFELDKNLSKLLFAFPSLAFQITCKGMWCC